MPDYGEEIRCLRLAELQFRLASAVRLSVAVGTQPLDLPVEWTHGKHRVRYSEIAITKDEADCAAWNLHQSATFLMAVAIKDAIRVAVPDPKTHLNADVRSAYQISRLIRNAFTHRPFCPVWSIDPDCSDQVFEVRDIIKLNTKGLNGTPFDWRHYGGPLALLRLSQFIRVEILGDTPSSSPVIPLPTEV